MPRRGAVKTSRWELTFKEILEMELELERAKPFLRFAIEFERAIYDGRIDSATIPKEIMSLLSILSSKGKNE